MLNRVLETCTDMMKISESVKINEEKIKEVSKKMENMEYKHWIIASNSKLLNLPIEKIVNFLLIFDSIDFSFWGEPKWTVKLKNGKLKDGSFALMEKLFEYYEENKNLDFTKVSFEEFSKILEGNVDIPFIEERYNIVYEISKIVNEKMNGNFYNFIKNIYDDNTLFDVIITNFKSFEDYRVIGGRNIYFYKLAQLLISDILHLREYKENAKVDVSHLVGCSDYKIPQILRGLGILEYLDELEILVDNKKVLGPNSRFEVEIRAATIVAINKIKEYLKNKFLSIEINDMLWELSHDSDIKLKPYHLTRTMNY